jgi:hypothetical protein
MRKLRPAKSPGWLRLQFGNLDQWIDGPASFRRAAMVLRLSANRAACLGALETPRLAILRQSPGMGAASRLWLAIRNASGPGRRGYISIDHDIPPMDALEHYERITQRYEAYEMICNLYLLDDLAEGGKVIAHQF